jgi:hypothetical protein
MLVSLSRRPAVPHYLGLIVQPIVFAMHFANSKYWGTWQLPISYRLEENDMTEDDLNDHPQSGWLYCMPKSGEIRRNISTSV